MTDEEQAWLDRLEQWMGADADIRRFAWAVISEHDCRNAEQLLTDHIDAFAELYEAIETMVEDIPDEDMARWER